MRRSSIIASRSGCRSAAAISTTLLTVLAVLTLPSVTMAITLPTHLRHPPPTLAESVLETRAENPENVILADCRDASGVLSSQMAYYNGSATSKPVDVAVVSTPAGQTALWVSKTTTGLFTDTGVSFTAVLGPKVGEGQFAGTGDNGYGSFSCWQTYINNLYTYDNTVCSQVYDCNHDPAPAPTPTPAANATAVPNNGTAGASSNGGDSGLSVGAEVAIVVGVVAAVAIAVAAATFAWLRYRAHRRRQLGLPPTRGFCASCCGGRARPAELYGNKRFIPAHLQRHPPDPAMAKKEPEPGVVYELDSQWHAAEAFGDSCPGEIDSLERQGELDGATPPAEMDTKDRQYAQYMSRRNNVEPITQ